MPFFYIHTELILNLKTGEIRRQRSSNLEQERFAREFTREINDLNVLSVDLISNDYLAPAVDSLHVLMRTIAATSKATIEKHTEKLRKEMQKSLTQSSAYYHLLDHRRDI